MTDATPSPFRDRRRLGLVAALAVLLVAGGALVAGLAGRGPGASSALPAPGLAAPVDAEALSREAFAVLGAVLARAYDAFALTEEGAIYDALAQVAAGEALEALYLERAGALASGGLPDQVVHELRLLDARWGVEDGALEAAVRWAVLGEVGHAEHTHVRGNAYAADLTIAPADGAWRLTGFALREVDRSGAGTLTTLTAAERAAHDAAPAE